MSVAQQPPRLDFDTLRRVSAARIPFFKTPKGKIVHPDGTVNNWPLSQWSNAAFGEVGEAANVIKKIERGDFEDDADRTERAYLHLGEEMADAVIYLDLLAQRAGLDLGECVRRKFNKDSDKQGLNIYL
jgi:NTP pyrophosphatase (non-canonical NTP hydrolase)